MIKLTLLPEGTKEANRVYLVDKNSPVYPDFLTEEELEYINRLLEKKVSLITLNHYRQQYFFCFLEISDDRSNGLEKARKIGNQCHAALTSEKLTSAEIHSLFETKELMLAFTEGLALSSYQFLNYFEDAADKKFTLNEVHLVSDLIPEQEILELSNLVEAVFHTRRLIDEPLSYLTAGRLAEEIQELSKLAGFDVKVLDKAAIEAQQFGGLLAVNRGSIDPPTFSILEWNPGNKLNQKPIVLVGKGIVYDTGGLSLKPTGNSMDYMKSDMAGAASVVGLFYAAAKNKLPVHIIGLIPATDNRPGLNAYTPGDVVKMHSGLHVEVLNTDAEGRMILADALSYAKQYDPELVIDLATLTGAAAIAIGTEGIVAMRTAGDEAFSKLMNAGKTVYERLVEFPLWEEYAELIKSDVADIKNVGGREAGAITAGKFLQRFTDYPWIHLDIAGPSFSFKKDSYRGKGGVGTGTRLLYEFLKKI